MLSKVFKNAGYTSVLIATNFKIAS